MVEICPTQDEHHRERILDVLGTHAKAAGHPFTMEAIALEAKDGETWLGGITAKMGSDWVYVEFLAVADAERGRGIGAQLMKAVEKRAQDAGRIGIWVDTFTFQAPGFYEKLGYTCFGRIDDYPPGSARHFYCKRLELAAKETE
jgi:GNAT superfamily N-acetyltransferase